MSNFKYIWGLVKFPLFMLVFCISIVLIFSACSYESFPQTERTDGNSLDHVTYDISSDNSYNFVVVSEGVFYNGSHYAIVYDSTTFVMYIYIQGGYVSQFYVLYDSNGLPRVYNSV